jgi:chaperonin GroES
MTIRLVGPKVLVRPCPIPEQTRSGLFLAVSAQERPQLGRVVAVGEYWPFWTKGQTVISHLDRRPLDVKVNQLVLFPKYHDLTVEINGELLLELRHDELIAVVEE